MILFYGEGRLGNQIFQYQALNRIAKLDEIIVAIGLENIQEMFELRGARLVVLSHSLLVKRLFKFVIIPLLLFPLARVLRLFNYACETVAHTGQHTGNSGDMRINRGLFSIVTFVNGGYFQNPSLWNSVFPSNSLRIHSLLQKQASQFLSEHVPEHAVPVFVHIRRGDYLDYHAYGLCDLALPETFYRRAIRDAVEQIPSVHFVFVTDDESWVTETFADIHPKCISSRNARFDFVLMANCRGGILSNSTYSLGAALLMEKPVVIIAPEFWFGFRVNAWYPPAIRIAHQCVNYIPVMA